MEGETKTRGANETETTMNADLHTIGTCNRRTDTCPLGEWGVKEKKN